MTVLFDEKARYDMLNYIDFDDFLYDGTPIRDMKVEELDAFVARKYIASFHYSHTFPDSTLFSYGGYLNGKLCGVVCYGMGCGKNQYTSLIPDIKNGEYLELTRLWCADSYPINTESKLISKSLKLLPKEIKLVVSFADEQEGHCGIIYQATNWYYCGMSAGGRSLVTKDGLKKHTRLLGIYRMRHPEYKEYSNEELLNLLGYSYTEAGKKYRYVYLRGTHKEKKENYEFIKDKILPYPKVDKKEDTKDERESIKEVDFSLIGSTKSNYKLW